MPGVLTFLCNAHLPLGCTSLCSKGNCSAAGGGASQSGSLELAKAGTSPLRRAKTDITESEVPNFRKNNPLEGTGGFSSSANSVLPSGACSNHLTDQLSSARFQPSVWETGEFIYHTTKILVSLYVFVMGGQGTKLKALHTCMACPLSLHS